MLPLESNRLFVNSNKLSRHPAPLWILPQFFQQWRYLPQWIFLLLFLWIFAGVVKSKVTPQMLSPFCTIYNLLAVVGLDIKRMSEGVIAKDSALGCAKEPEAWEIPHSWRVARSICTSLARWMAQSLGMQSFLHPQQQLWSLLYRSYSFGWIRDWSVNRSSALVDGRRSQEEAYPWHNQMARLVHLALCWRREISYTFERNQVSCYFQKIWKCFWWVSTSFFSMIFYDTHALGL